ncbi:MAG: LapA family protein [Candidatus Zixiibacteriota bacterium]|nr:MAG: LapA family protein [candidate division Zixibacteria bacterium]
MWVVRAIIIALLVIVVVAFAYFNFSPSQKVDVNLIYVKYLDVPLVTVVFWSFVAGVLVSLVLFISVYIRLSVQIRTASRRVTALEGEVAVLRNRPIEESADLLKGADEKQLEVESPFTDDGE